MFGRDHDAPPPVTPTQTVAEFIAACRLEPALDLGAPGALVYPVHAPRASSREHALLSEVIGEGVIVTEIDGGTVPLLRLDNRLAQKVLGFEGELLVGCKQNRVLNTTVLVDAEVTTDIPVSCIEQSRWHHRSATMSASDSMSPRAVKRGLKRSVSQSLHTHGTHTSDQGAIWNSVARLADSFDTHSNTGDLDAVVAARSAGDTARLEQLLDAGLTGASGYALELDGRLVALEVLGHPEDFRRMRRRMIRPLATELASHHAADAPARRNDAPLERLRDAVLHLSSEGPAVGLGSEVRVASRRTSISLSALVEEGQTVAVSALG